MNAIPETDTALPGYDINPQWEDELLARFRQLDDVERLIFTGAVEALAQGAFTIDQFKQWTRERFIRHRAGEELSIADLKIPGLRPNAPS